MAPPSTATGDPDSRLLPTTKDKIMKFNLDAFINTSGTSLVGRLHCSFQEIIDKFGMPNCGPSGDHKTQVEWHIEFEDGVIATIYDYKEGEIPPEQIGRWSVGGRSEIAYSHVLGVMNG